jgi:hypothetical protein
MNYDRVILELLDRISVLEEKVDSLQVGAVSEQKRPDKSSNSASGNSVPMKPKGKDTSRYSFQGNTYGKGRLVLAVVQAYFNENPSISATELVLTFNRAIQGSLGVVRELSDLKRTCPDYQRRFFAYEDEIIHTPTGDCAVCSQWGKPNINGFIDRASELGYTIELKKDK